MKAKGHACVLEDPGMSTLLVDAEQVPAVQERISLAMAKAAAVDREFNAAELPPMFTCPVATQTDTPPSTADRAAQTADMPGTSYTSVSICLIFA